MACFSWILNWEMWKLFFILPINLEIGKSGRPLTAAQVICEEIINRMDCLYASETTWQQKGSRFIKRLWRILLHQYREQRAPSDGYAEQKMPEITSKEIKQVLSLLMKTSEMNVSYNTRYFAKNCYLLSPIKA